MDSISKQVAEMGKNAAIGITAGIEVGGELLDIGRANNNWRKMHGLPMYHRNRPSMRMAERSKLRRWVTEHKEEEEDGKCG